jgi:hypothetical protein
LFFLYPIFLLRLLDGVGDSDARRGLELTLWGVFLFPTVAAAIPILLLPAAWRGPRYAEDSGTPWAWPWFPWSPFIYLAVGVVLRTYWLTITFHPTPGMASGFAPYFLTPFLLGVSLLVFEIGRSAGSQRIQAFALGAPLIVLWFSMPGLHWLRKVSGVFLSMYMDRLGAPVLVAWWGLVGLYVYAWLRGFRKSEWGVALLLISGAFVGRDTVDLRSLQSPSVEPLLAASVLHVVLAVFRPASSARWFLAQLNVLATLSVALRNTPFMIYHGVIPLHLLLIATLMLGLVFRDRFAQWLRVVSFAALVGASGLAILMATAGLRIPPELLSIYLATLAVIAWGCWHATGSSTPLAAAIMISVGWIGHASYVAADLIRRQPSPQAVLLLMGGAGSFLVAAAISLSKAGIWRKLSNTANAQWRMNANRDNGQLPSGPA